MGNYNSQELNSTISNMFSLSNIGLANCISSGSQTQLLEVLCNYSNAPPGESCSVNIIGNKENQVAVYNTSCIGTINNNTNISQQISNQAQTVANQIAQQFQLSANVSQQITNVLTQIGTQITNQDVTSCVNSVSQTQGAVVACPPPGPNCSVNVVANSFQQAYTPLSNCILSASNSTGLVQQISNIVQQSTSQRIESIFGPLIYLLLGIIIVIGAILYKGEQAITDWRLWALVIAVTLIYLVIAFFLRIFPFEPKMNSTTQAVTPIPNRNVVVSPNATMGSLVM